MPNSETKNFSQNVSSSYHLEDKNKNVPKLRFKGYHDEWVEYILEEKGIFLKGSPISKNDISQYGKPCILYGELYTKYNEVATKIFSATNIQDKNLVTSKINDVLIPSSGETAIDISTATCILNDGVILGGDINIYRNKDCDGRFISYSINHKNRRKIAKLAQGATIFHLYPNFLKKFKILLPSLIEQEKIASFLTLIDKKIEKQKELVKLLKKYKRGLLSAIFSQKLRFKDNNGNDYPIWKTVTIKDTLNYEQPQKYIVKTENYSNEYSIPVLTANKAFVLGYINEVEGVYDKGDTIIYDDFTMDFKFVNFKFKVKSSAIKILTTKDNYSLYFMFNLLTRLNLKPQGHQRSYLSILEPMKILCPSFDEQEKIASFLYNIDKNIDQKIKYLNKLEFTKKGLLQQMFI